MPITYPIPAGSTFVVYRKSTQTILKKGVSWPREDGQPITNLDPDIGILIIVKQPDPPFNPATEKLAPLETPRPGLEEYWVGTEVIALTQAELDAIAEAAADAALKAEIEAAIDDMKNGVGTSVVRFQRLEKAVAFLLRKFLQQL